MTTTECVANAARAFVVAEIAMASVNSGAAKITPAQAEKLLHDPPIRFLTLRGNTFVHQSYREAPFDSLSY
jgi:hypothetical protein